MRYNRPRHSSLSVVSTAQLLLGCNRIGYYVVEQTWGTRFGHNAEYVRRAQGSESDHCSSRPATRHQSATSSNRNTSSPTIRSCSSPSTLRRRCGISAIPDKLRGAGPARHPRSSHAPLLTVIWTRTDIARAVRSWSLRLSALMDSDLAWVNGKSGR